MHQKPTKGQNHTMDTIRYGMIGFGGIAENRLAREGFAMDRSRFEPIDGIELLGATDVNPARRQAAETLGLRWYASAGEVLADPAVDAVVIATNNATHAPLARQAMPAGKHCLVEKPMATTLPDAEAMVGEAKQHKLSLAVDHMMTRNAANVEARRRIREQTLGPVESLCLHMEFLYGSTPQEAASWRCAKPAELGGPIGDVASHCLYMAEFLLDAELEITACQLHPRTLPIAVEQGATIRFATSGGTPGTIRVSFGSRRGGQIGTISNLGFEVYGQASVLRSYGTMFQLSGHADEPVRIRLEEQTAKGVRDVTPPEVTNIYQAVVRDHAESIRTGRPLSGEPGLHNLRLILDAKGLSEI